jgi:hypothetical protein
MLFLVHPPALDPQPQLWTMIYYSRLGSDALVNAALAGNLMLDLEVLESLGCDHFESSE